MNHTLQSAIEKIKHQRIVPEARWKYRMRKYGVWSVFALLVLFGAMSLAIAYDAISQLDWDVYRFVQESAVSYTLSLIPYVWLVAIGIFLALAFFDFRKTETGYRYGLLTMSLLSIGGMVAIGALFVMLGWGATLGIFVSREIPYYQKHFAVTKKSQWMQPDRGLLAGTIESASGSSLLLKDLSEKSWIVIVSEDTTVRSAVSLEEGVMVKIIGTANSGQIFMAKEIRPWAGMGMMNGSGNGQGRGGMNK